MINTDISDLLGISCELLSDEGNIAMIDTSFSFEDGDFIRVFVEKMGQQVRFFDGGETLLHLIGRGIVLDDHRKTRFIRTLAEPTGVALTETGELEIWARSEHAPGAFARFMSALLAVVRWEQEQKGVATDIALLIDEVAFCLRTIKPGALTEAPEFIGISGAVYKMDFNFDGDAVLAINVHHSSVSSAAKKILDIRAEPANADLDVIVVIDDRHDASGAKKEGLILGSIAKVWMMSRLEKEAGLASISH